jgi:hypothetical protein
MQLEAAKEGVSFKQEPNKKGLSLHRFTLEKRESEKLVEGISSFEIAAEGEIFI